MTAEARRAWRSFLQPWLGVVLMMALLSGCATRPTILAPEQRTIIDRSIVECPPGYKLELFAVDLTAPTAITFDENDNLIIAQGGIGGVEPAIFGFKPDGTRFEIYTAPKGLSLLKNRLKIYGPIGGMTAWEGKVYVSHRDAQRRGVITAFDYEGNHETIVGDLPAQGDHSVTDLAVNPVNGRLYFGVGSATNSGVVGLDNWEIGWVQDHRDFCDIPAVDYRLTPARFTSPNPRAGLFGGSEISVTSAYQPFGKASLRAHGSPVDRPTAAIYSVALGGGGLRVEAHGVRYPRGLAFNEFANLYMTNQGMELRGTRPVKDDPDALLYVVQGGWYGWPDYSTSLEPITEPRYQPDPAMIIASGYPELSFLIDHEATGLVRPNRETALRAVFAPLSGAAKLDFVPSEGPFSSFAGMAIVALMGDRAPFATSGRPLIGPIGRKIVAVDVERKQVADFIYNTRGLPASRLGRNAIGALERPIDVKFGPRNAALYIVDLGEMEMKSGRESIKPNSGKILRLVPITNGAESPDYVPVEYQGTRTKAHLRD